VDWLRDGGTAGSSTIGALVMLNLPERVLNYLVKTGVADQAADLVLAALEGDRH
jgi:hypothetical protein